MKIRPVGAALFHADGHETNGRFSQLRERAQRLARTITFASCMLSLTIVYFSRCPHTAAAEGRHFILDAVLKRKLNSIH